MHLYTFVFRVCVLILQCESISLDFEFSREGSNWPTPILKLDLLMHLYMSINRQNIEHSGATILNIILTENMLPIFDRFVCENAKI